MAEKSAYGRMLPSYIGLVERLFRVISGHKLGQPYTSAIGGQADKIGSKSDIPSPKSAIEGEAADTGEKS